MISIALLGFALIMTKYAVCRLSLPRKGNFQTVLSVRRDRQEVGQYV